jgi:Cft2 family RNA processing exonuclease
MQKRLPVFFCRTRIDHSGLTSKLVKEGFSGKIYGTQATKDLAEILLYGALTVILTIFAALYVAKMQRK